MLKVTMLVHAGVRIQIKSVWLRSPHCWPLKVNSFHMKGASKSEGLIVLSE